MQSPWYLPFILWGTSLCDLFATTLSAIGLLWTYASVYMMLRGSLIVFSAIFSILIFKRRLYAFHWIGISTATIGLVVVGVSDVFNQSSESPAALILFGDLLIVVGMILNAFQFNVEEYFVKKYKISPMIIVGGEGCWGMLMMIFFVLPIVFVIPGSNYGSYENALEAAYMIGENSLLLILVLVYTVGITFYNFCAVTIAKILNATIRTFVVKLSHLSFLNNASLLFF